MAREKMEIETEPEEEWGEMVELLQKDGYKDPEIQVIMERLSRDKDLWLREMMRRELKVNAEDAGANSYSQAGAAGVAFLLLSLMAVSPYASGIPRIDALAASVGASLLALFALGSRLFIPRNFRPRAGLESAAIGALAGAILYVLGLAVSTL
jgi:vacuolar iron transporter family protein